MRRERLWLLCLMGLALLAGCQGGGGSGQAFSGAGGGGSTGSLAVSLQVRQLARVSRVRPGSASSSSISSLVFHVLNATSQADVISPVTVQVTGQTVTQALAGIPVGEVVVEVLAFTANDSTPIGSAVSSPVAVTGGSTTSVTLTLLLGQSTPTPTPTPTPTSTPTPTPTPVPTPPTTHMFVSGLDANNNPIVLRLDGIPNVQATADVTLPLGTNSVQSVESNGSLDEMVLQTSVQATPAVVDYRSANAASPLTVNSLVQDNAFNDVVAAFFSPDLFLGTGSQTSSSGLLLQALIDPAGTVNSTVVDPNDTSPGVQVRTDPDFEGGTPIAIVLDQAGNVLGIPNPYPLVNTNAPTVFEFTAGTNGVQPVAIDYDPVNHTLYGLAVVGGHFGVYVLSESQVASGLSLGLFSATPSFTLTGPSTAGATPTNCRIAVDVPPVVGAAAVDLYVQVPAGVFFVPTPGTQTGSVAAQSFTGIPSTVATLQSISVDDNQFPPLLRQALVVANGGSDNLSVIRANPNLGPFSGFTSPTFTAAPIKLWSEIGAGTSTFFVALNSSTNNLVPVTIDNDGNTQTLTASTVPGTITSLLIFPGLAYIGTNAATNNFTSYAVNADGTLGAVLSTVTLGGAGNVPVSILSLNNGHVYVVTNGTGTNLFELNENTDGSVSGVANSQTLGGSGNTPVAISFPNGSGFDFYVITNGSSGNNFFSINNSSLAITNQVQAGSAGDVPVALTPGGTANNEMFVLTSAPSGNVIPFPIDSSGDISAALAAGTIGGTGNTPVAAAPTTDDASNGSVDGPPAVFAVTGGNSQNVWRLPINSDGTLGTPQSANAGSAPVGVSNL